MKLGTHYAFHDCKGIVTRAMAGIKLCLRVSRFHSLRKYGDFFLSLLVIKQMKAAYYGPDRIRTCCQDILQPIMGATCKEQTASIKSQLVTEVIIYIVAFSILHKQMLVSLWHWMNLRYVRYDVYAVTYLTGFVNK